MSSEVRCPVYLIRDLEGAWLLAEKFFLNLFSRAIKRVLKLKHKGFFLTLFVLPTVSLFFSSRL